MESTSPLLWSALLGTKRSVEDTTHNTIINKFNLGSRAKALSFVTPT